MIPIYEQGDGNGIGHTLDTFVERFDEICAEHIESKRAKSFAFVLYDFHNRDIKKILRNQGVFVKLDRLSGDKISIFYLHGTTGRAIKKFNTNFIVKLGIESEVILPCVVFFKLADDGISEIQVANLESANLIHGFNELSDVFECYISDNKNNDGSKLGAIKVVKGASKFLSMETARGLVRELIGLAF